MDGIPVISLTENIEPDVKLLVTENNLPWEPLTTSAVDAVPTSTTRDASDAVVFPIAILLKV